MHCCDNASAVLSRLRRCSYLILLPVLNRDQQLSLLRLDRGHHLSDLTLQQKVEHGVRKLCRKAEFPKEHCISLSVSQVQKQTKLAARSAPVDA